MNILRIREKLPEYGLDAIILFSPVCVRYAMGFEIQDGCVAISADDAVLITDSRYIEVASKLAKNARCLCAAGSGSNGKSQNQLLKEFFEKNKCEKIGCEEGNLPHGSWVNKEELLGTKLVFAQKLIMELRQIKTEDEVKAIIGAQRIAEKALEEVLGILKPGMTEAEVAAEITYRMMRNGGEGNSFAPIVVSGPNSSMPHGIPGSRKLQKGDFVTMDFGCLLNGYCSDMTRTVAIGEATDEMKKVYDTVLKAQKAGILKAKAGVTGADIHNAAAKVIADAGYGAYFGHGFGHSLGLEIHEAPAASPSNPNPVPEGVIVTAEPGIYLPGKFGVRIEDMILIEANGNRNLTEAPKDLLIL